MLKKTLLFLFFIAMPLSSLAAQYTIFHGGDIVTMEGDATEYVEAVVTKDDKIVYTGSKAYAFKHFPNSAKKFNLKGRTMLPGFIEPHAHLASISAFILSHDIVAAHEWRMPHKTYPGASTHEAYLEAVKNIIDDKKDKTETVVIWGYHKLWHGELTLKDLDSVTKDVPTIIFQRSAHEIYVNSAAIKKYAINNSDIKEKSLSDFKNNHYWDGAFLELKTGNLASVFADQKALKLGMDRISQMMLKNGITAIAQPGFPATNFEAEYSMLKYATEKSPFYSIFLIPGAAEQMALNMETDAYFDRLKFYETKYDTENIKFLPYQFKIFADGDIYSLNLQLQEGFYNCKTCKGKWLLTPKEAEKLFNFYWDKGFKIHVDITGDLGVKEYNGIVERAMKRNPRENHRTTYHNLGYFTSIQAQKMAVLGIEASVNPYYLWALADKYNETGLGPKRVDNLVASRQLTKRGIPVSLHSGFAMAPAEPLKLAWIATNRIVASGKIKRPVESISMFNTIKGITLTAARTLNLEDSIGSIKKGKQATFTLLKQNPFKIDPFNIKNIPIAGVVYKGRVKLNKN